MGQPRPCSCGCAGQTKGGRFLPGHDSTLVKTTVAAVLKDGGGTELIPWFKSTYGDALGSKLEKMLKLARDKANNPPTPKRPRAGVTKVAMAESKVDSLMTRINGSYWAGMVGRIDVIGSGEVAAKVQKHNQETGMLTVLLTFDGGQQQISVVNKAKFRKDEKQNGR